MPRVLSISSIVGEGVEFLVWVEGPDQKSMEFSSQLGDEICLELVKLQLHVLPESLHEGVKDGAGMTTVLDVVGMLELSSGGSIMDPRPRDVAEPCIL